jgi:hypothetical protein
MNKELQTAISICSEWFDMKPKTVNLKVPDGRIIKIDGTLYLISAIIFKFDSGNFVRVQQSEITNHIVRAYFIDPVNGSSIEIPAYLEYKILDSISI